MKLEEEGQYSSVRRDDIKIIVDDITMMIIVDDIT